MLNILHRFFPSSHTARATDRIIRVAKSQDDFGYKKYGKYLDPEDDFDWLEMAEEELVDLMKYLNAERESRSIDRDKLFKRVLVSQNLIKDAQSGRMEPMDVLKSLEREMNTMRTMLEDMGRKGTTKS